MPEVTMDADTLNGFSVLYMYMGIIAKQIHRTIKKILKEMM